MTSTTPENPFHHLKVRYLILWSVTIIFLLGFCLGFATTQFNFELTDPIWFPLFYVLFFGLLCLWVFWQFKRLNIKLKHIVGQTPASQRWISILGLVMAILFFSFGSFLILFYFISFLAPTVVEAILNDDALQAGAQSSSPNLYMALMAFVVVIVAPVVEEFVFRGILLQRWAVKWGVRSALITSSLLFGILHANVIGLSIFGLVMGVLYIRTRTLIVPIVSHALNNAIAVGMGLLPNDAENTLSDVQQLQSFWWVGLIFIALSAPWLWRFFYLNWPSKNVVLPYFANSGQQQ